MMVFAPGQSNAANSKNAKLASEKAWQATDAVKSSDSDSHGKASSAHWDASYANERAGNTSKANEHKKQAQVHSEKASEAYRDKDYAQGIARSAETLTQKAEKSEFGQDKNEARSTKELHTDAAAMHDKASKAFAIAKCPTEVAYHQAKAEKHTKLAGAA